MQGSGTHQDGIHLAPDFMPEGPGFFTGDPLGVTLGSGNATVQSGGALKNNKRGMMPDIPEKILDQSFRLDLKQPARHIHAVLGQKFKSAGSLWIGIRQAATTRRIPALRILWVQGGVLPK